jgi:hypothetical protein
METIWRKFKIEPKEVKARAAQGFAGHIGTDDDTVKTQKLNELTSVALFHHQLRGHDRAL